jgi:parallel beta-helix repeat protein
MKRKMRFILSIITACGALGVPQALFAATYTVTSTADSGPGTLRQAILDANANPGVDIIQFQIAASGNLFEGSGGNTYAVIQINASLPTITEGVTIDGTTQTNTNTGSVAGLSVGVDNIALSAIAYPDVYIVPSASFVFPSTASGIAGNGICIDAAGVTIKGLAVSGFGNTHTNGGNASAHADISVLRSPVVRTVNITITECFLSCDPLGAQPSAALRRTKSNSILVLGNNEVGTISNNYIAYSGTYGIHFNGNTDNLNVGPASTTVGNRSWTVSGNRLLGISTNATISAITRISDGITLMKCTRFRIRDNYISDVEQTGIDIGYNSDENYVDNNTVTGMTRTNAFGVQAAMRIGLCSEKDTLIRNVITNNTGTNFKGGVWIDRSTLSQAGVTVKNNSYHVIQENRISGNNGSGVVLSTNSTGGCFYNKITRNSFYENTGLGIDLNLTGTTGTTAVSLNDDTDGDAGPNFIQNFPIIDSVKAISGNRLILYGKAPAGSTVEFYLNDGQANKHGGTTCNYGEGKIFVGSAVEGSADDLASGTGAYIVDGNVASSENLFVFIIPYTTVLTSESVTATATISDNTSEFGPAVAILIPLDAKLYSFNAVLSEADVRLKWEAANDDDFQYFEVEHSTNARNFTSIGTVFPGRTGQDTDYEFTHRNAPEINYYRLKMVNRTGRLQYSTILMVKAITNKKQMVSNTGFTNSVNVTLSLDSNQPVQLSLVNAEGKVIRTQAYSGSRGMNYLQLNRLEGLSPGVHILVAEYDGFCQTQKLVKTGQ